MQQIDSDETLIAEPVELSEVNSGGIGLAALMRCSVSDHNAHTSHILLTWRMLAFLGLRTTGSVLYI